MTFRELIDQGWSIRVFGLGEGDERGRYGYLATNSRCFLKGHVPTWEALESELSDRHERALQSGAIR